MPQRCIGFADPSGGQARPCIFARDGLGHPARVLRGRDGDRCVFCCPAALERALLNRVAKGHLMKRLKTWCKRGSPVYAAAFSFGALEALPEDTQCTLRWKAGEKPRLNLRTSWLHKNRQRLVRLLFGRPIPKAKPMSRDVERFGWLCEDFKGRPAAHYAWVQAVRLEVRVLCRARRKETEAAKEQRVKQCMQVRGGWRGWGAVEARKRRRDWWRCSRVLRVKLSPRLAQGPPYPIPVQWAIQFGVLSEPSEARRA